MLYEQMRAEMLRLHRLYPPDNRNLVVHPLDLHMIDTGAPDRLSGFPVVTSEFVARGQVFLVKPLALTDVWDPNDFRLTPTRAPARKLRRP
jgi:hypothetical protein